MVEVGFVEDGISRAYDIVNLSMIVLNIAVSIALTFDEARAAFGGALLAAEAVTLVFFSLDYIMRIWTADHLYPDMPKAKATLRYFFSISGIVDLLSFLPAFLPAFFPRGTAVFRVFRVMRSFKIFRIGAYSDSFSVISAVIYSKKQQLITSMSMIIVLMIAASLCMYSVEHDAQPLVFQNALSGLWWAGSTLLTVGYGDIYPVTTLGRIMGTVIAFLGVGAVAVPTGIISAGFIEQYNNVKDGGSAPAEHNVRLLLTAGDSWAGKCISDISMPRDMNISEILRDGERIPRNKIDRLEAGDTLTIRVAFSEVTDE